MKIAITLLFVMVYLNAFSVSFRFTDTRWRVCKFNNSRHFSMTRTDQLMPAENSMNMDEIMAELDLRGVDYKDCFLKSDLVRRLTETRVTGKANPGILKKLNDGFTENPTSTSLDDDILDNLVAKDGRLPGGMSKDMMKALSGDPEIIAMLRDPKMQDIMGAVMTGGPEAMQKYISNPGKSS